MKIRNYLTEIRAEVNGTIQVFSGPMVPGTSFEEAQKYCEENGLGYCIVVGVEDEVTELKREIDRLQEKIKELETMERYYQINERLRKDPLIQPYKLGDTWYGTSTNFEGNGVRQGFKSRDCGLHNKMLDDFYKGGKY